MYKCTHKYPFYVRQVLILAYQPKPDISYLRFLG